MESDMAVPTAGRPPRVLLVDDDVESLALLREVLESEGMAVVGEARSGAEGVGQAASLQPDVVLMDLRMDGIGGLEATRLIKERDPFIQVVVLTAYDEPLPRRSAQEFGAYAYLVKGCSAALMRDVITQACLRAAEERRARARLT